MANIGCPCGSIISDSSDMNPNKATFLRSENGNAKDRTFEAISSLIEANKNGKQEDWIKEYFNNTVSAETKLEWLLIQIYMKKEHKYEGMMFQCSACGRILIEKNDQGKYASFTPEGKEGLNIFNGITLQE